MSEQLEELFRGLREQRPPAVFAPAENVRRRGQQRSRRTALTAGVATMALVGFGFGVSHAVVRGEGPDPAHPRPPASVSPDVQRSTTLPERMLIQPSDLGPGEWRPVSAEVFSGVLWWWVTLCDRPVADPPSLAHRIEMRHVSYGIRGPRDETVSEIAERYEAGWAARSLAEARSTVRSCSGDGNRYSVVETGFAGEESMLVRLEQVYFDGESPAPDPFVSYAAAARVGDVVLIIVPGTRDAAYTRNLASKAVERLG